MKLFLATALILMQTGCLHRNADEQPAEYLKEFRMEFVRKGLPPSPVAEEVGKHVVKESPGSSLMKSGDMEGYICRFKKHPLSLFLDEYSRLTGKEVVNEAPEPDDGITFSLDASLPVEEAVKAMEAFLRKKNIILVPDGDNRWKAVRK